MLPSRPLPEVLSDILTLQGAVLEKTPDDCLEFLAPPVLSEMLGIPEHGKMSFAYQPAPGEAISAAYDSDLFRAIARLFPEKNQLAMALYPSPALNMAKMSGSVEEKIVLANATFRLKQTESRAIRYLLGFFKYTALSDEKREGLMSLLVNELNLSTSAAGERLTEIMGALQEADPDKKPNPEITKVFQAARSAAALAVVEELGPFGQSLNKRLNRDIKRVFEYYETIKIETQKAMEKKALSGEQSVEKQREKVNAIETEKRWKIQDLISKYALNIRIELVAFIVVETQSPVFWIEIKRRLSSRPFPLTYNPLLRKWDPLPCESCFYPRGGYSICDDKLHIICSACFKKCSQCGKPFCSACHKHGCPRCSKGTAQ
ncbi:MAG: hypothetical protein FJ117_09270 [Deltaproteobacteria bacterium]|nr:hypothetical protein [Deltaproteobacteria bacterium]